MPTHAETMSCGNADAYNTHNAASSVFMTGAP